MINIKKITLSYKGRQMQTTERFSISIETSLARKMDKMATASGFSNRSAFVRDLIRREIAREAWEHNDNVAGTITLVYDHHTTGLSERIIAIQHDAQAHILASTHVHLDHHHCMEMIMAKGKASDLKDLAGALRKERGVLHAELSTGAPTDVDSLIPHKH